MRCPNCDHDTPDQGQFCESLRCASAHNVPSVQPEQPAQRQVLRVPAALSCSQNHSQIPSRRRWADLPRYLRERILTSRQALLGERKQVTVLFADTKGSLEQIQDLDLEEISKWLGLVLRTMIDAVHRYEGTVSSRLQGDGIMALFGAPLAQEDHAVRACHAAIAMQEAVRAIQGRASEIRVGLNSGEVVVHSISDDLGMHYDAIGVTVHLAGRMEQLAVPGTIRLTGETFRHVQEFVVVKPLGPTRIRGLDHPVDVFELTGMLPVGRRWHARMARELTQFVGRDEEVALLHAAIARVRGGKGEMIAVVGDPGTGKSRLVHEFLRSEVLRTSSCLKRAPRHTDRMRLTSPLRASYGPGSRSLTETILRRSPRNCVRS